MRIVHYFLKSKGYMKLVRRAMEASGFKTGEGWLYLTVVLNLFDGKVTGLTQSSNLKAKIQQLLHEKWTSKTDQLQIKTFSIQAEVFNITDLIYYVT